MEMVGRLYLGTLCSYYSYLAANCDTHKLNFDSGLSLCRPWMLLGFLRAKSHVTQRPGTSKILRGIDGGGAGHGQTLSENAVAALVAAVWMVPAARRGPRLT